MNTATVTKPAIEVKALLELGVELDLSEILVKELEQGLSSDISNIY